MSTKLLRFFFNDKLRGVVMVVLLIAILISTVGGWLRPKQQGLTPESLNTLNEVSRQISQSAEALTIQSEITAKLNQKLIDQLEEMEASREENYNSLLKKYGIGNDVIDPEQINYRHFIDSNNSLDRLFPEINLEGSGFIYEGQGSRTGTGEL